jgi:hypothetical protein
MASVIYDHHWEGIALALNNLSTGAVRVALVSASYTAAKSHMVWTTSSGPGQYQMTGTGYTAGGRLMTGKSVAVNHTSNLLKWDGADVTWTTSTITNAAGVCLYFSAAVKRLVAFYSFGTLKTSAAGNFTIQWATGGLIKYKQGT